MRARLLPLLPPALVAAATAAVFLPTVRFGFLPFDDYQNVGVNPMFHGAGAHGLGWAVTSRVLGHWIPLTWLSFGLDYALWGRRAGGYHATNVLLHAADAVLFYLVARRLLGGALGDAPQWAVRAGAAMAALAFGIHPLRAESVAWVTERRDVVSGLFFFLALLAYLRAVDADGGGRRWWLALSVGAFAASLLGKEITMTLPLVLLLVDVYPLRRRRWRSTLLEKIPFAVVALAGAVVAARSVAADIGFTGLGRLGLPARLALFAYSAVFYPVQTLLPVDVSPLHELPLRVDPLAPRFLASTVAAVALTVAAVAARRAAPWLGAAWAYSVVTILPVSGLAHVSTILVADRYSYLTTLSWALVLGGGLAALLSRPRGAALGVASVTGAALLLGGWAYLAHAEVRAWRDAESLWTAAVAVDPGCGQCHAGLAIAYLAVGRLAEAEREATVAVVLRPDRADHHAVLASVLERRGQLDEAARSWATAGRLHPRYRADAGRALGLALAAHGRFEDAVRELRAARGFGPMLPVTADLVRALNGLAIERAGAGRLDAAAAALEEALALEPDSAELRENLAAVRRARR